MQVYNYLKMNDWEIKKFLKAVLAIQMVVWGVIALDIIGLQIPFLRQLICFFYLSYIPGIVILRVLKLHGLGTVETLLYSVGLSIATLMFTGLFMNMVYPFFGISAPISLIPLTITISAVVLLLTAVSVMRDRRFAAPAYISIKELLSPPALFLYLLPLLSVLGTYLVNYHDNNILLMSLIVVISLTVLLIAFERFIPQNLYPLAIFSIGLSLVFHRSLISPYISGHDIHEEYYLVNLVLTNGIWDSTIPEAYNAMLSISMLAPVSSIVCDISLTAIFKVIYPLWLALVPLGLYLVFQKQTDEKIAFFTCFFLVSAVFFYVGLQGIPRQIIATLFLVLSILTMVDKSMVRTGRAVLFTVFGVSMVVSHYGMAFAYIGYLIFAWLLLILASNTGVQRLKASFSSRFGRRGSGKPPADVTPVRSGYKTIGSPIILLSIILLVILSLGWYMYMSGSSVFHSLLAYGQYALNTISTGSWALEFEGRIKDFLTIEGPIVAALLYKVKVIVTHLISLFILTGVLTVLMRPRELKFEKEYLALSVPNFIIYFASINLPFLSSLSSRLVGTLRISYIALIFMAPFCVIGVITVLRIISRLVRVPWSDQNRRRWFIFLPTVFVLYFLFQTGFIWEAIQYNQGSLSLSQEGLKQRAIEQKAALYGAVTPKEEVFSARWLSLHTKAGAKVYATYDDARVHALTSYGMMPTEDVPMLTRTTKTISKYPYVYLQYLNVVEGVGTEFEYRSLPGTRHIFYEMTEISHLYAGKNKIYANGGSEIYK